MRPALLFVQMRVDVSVGAPVKREGNPSRQMRPKTTVGDSQIYILFCQLPCEGREGGTNAKRSLLFGLPDDAIQQGHARGLSLQ